MCFKSGHILLKYVFKCLVLISIYVLVSTSLQKEVFFLRSQLPDMCKMMVVETTGYRAQVIFFY